MNLSQSVMMTERYSLQILSATFGAVDVTSQMRQYYQEQVAVSPPNQWTTSCSRAMFPELTGVPSLATVLILVIVWSVGLNSGFNSDFRVSMCRENSQATIGYSGSNLPPIPAWNKFHIVSAFYHDKPVTDDVQGLIKSLQPKQDLNLQNFQYYFGDPAPGVWKALTITYGKELPGGQFEYNLVTAWDQSPLRIRPGPAAERLVIHAANFGGKDHTADFRQLVTFDQTLTVKPTEWRTYGWPDPWPGAPATFIPALTVMYSWGSRPLELVIASSRQEQPVILDPQIAPSPAHGRFFNPNDTYDAGETNILAITWGLNQGQTRLPASLYSFILKNGYFKPTNQWFGFDGWPEVTKIALVFYQYGITGPVQVAVARSGGLNGLLAIRGSQAADPVQGQALLRDDVAQYGFRLKKRTDGLLVCASPGKKTLVVGCDPGNDISIGTDQTRDGRNRAVLRIYGSNTQTLGWLVVGQNNSVGITSNREQASTFRYELPSQHNARAIIISFPDNASMRNQPRVLTFFPDNSIGAVPNGAADAYVGGKYYLVRPSDTVFTLDNGPGSTTGWNSSTLNSSLAHIQGPLVDPSVFAILSVVKDLTYDLAVILFAGGFHIPDRLVKVGVFKWWGRLPKDVQDEILDLLARLRTAFIASKPVGNDAGLSVKADAVFQAAREVIELVHDSNQLWRLAKTILSQHWSLLDIVVGVVSFMKVILKFGTGTATITWVDDFAIWVTQTVTDIKTLCTTTKPVTAVTGIVTDILQSSPIQASYLSLPVEQQSLVVDALTEPHIFRIIQGGPVKPPLEHQTSSLQGISGSSVVPKDPGLQIFQRAIGRLDADASNLVQKLLPKVEQGLLTWSPALLPGFANQSNSTLNPLGSFSAQGPNIGANWTGALLLPSTSANASSNDLIEAA